MVGIPARSTLLDATEYARLRALWHPVHEAFDPATQKPGKPARQLEYVGEAAWRRCRMSAPHRVRAMMRRAARRPEKRLMGDGNAPSICGAGIAATDRFRPRRADAHPSYGRMVAAGKWRDYAMDFHRDVAIFRPRHAERPNIA